MLSAIEEYIPFTFDQLKAYKDTIWSPLSAVKFISESVSNVITSLRERRQEKREAVEREAAEDGRRERGVDDTEMQDIPRQTTLNRHFTSKSNGDRDRARELMAEPKGKGLRELRLAQRRRQSSTIPPTSRDQPARPPPKKRDIWPLTSIILAIALICSVTPLAVLLHRCHARSPPKPAQPTNTISTATVMTTISATKTQVSWAAYTYISVVTSTYTFVPPAATTGLDAGASVEIIPATARQV